MTIEKAKLDYLEVMELAMYICELPDDAEDDQIDQTLCDKFEIGLTQFHALVELLVPLCATGSSPLTLKQYRGFAKGDMWLAKQEIAPATEPAKSAYAGSGFAVEDSCDADD
jgi:hypothetical protein